MARKTPGALCAKCREPVTEGQMLSESTAVKNLQEADPQRQQVEQPVPGAGGWEMESSWLLDTCSSW